MPKGPKITNCLRQLRFELGEMTQQELADELGVSRQTIISLESGRYYPSLQLTLQIANYFERPVESIFEIQQ
jgi:putative transcriptional regulator